MSIRKPRYPMEEFRRRGREIYERDILPKLGPDVENMLVAIDIESGAFELDPDGPTATDRLRARHPDAQVWLERVGHPTAFRLGAGSSRRGRR
jgi:hypothetical protein